MSSMLLVHIKQNPPEGDNDLRIYVIVSGLLESYGLTLFPRGKAYPPVLIALSPITRFKRHFYAIASTFRFAARLKLAKVTASIITSPASLADWRHLGDPKAQEKSTSS